MAGGALLGGAMKGDPFGCGDWEGAAGEYSCCGTVGVAGDNLVNRAWRSTLVEKLFGIAVGNAVAMFVGFGGAVPLVGAGDDATSPLPACTSPFCAKEGEVEEELSMARTGTTEFAYASDWTSAAEEWAGVCCGGVVGGGGVWVGWGGGNWFSDSDVAEEKVVAEALRWWLIVADEGLSHHIFFFNVLLCCFSMGRQGSKEKMWWERRLHPPQSATTAGFSHNLLFSTSLPTASPPAAGNETRREPVFKRNMSLFRFRPLASNAIRPIVPRFYTTDWRTHTASKWNSDQEIERAREWVEKFKVTDIPKKSCTITYSASSGPGGQNVNK